MSSPANGTSDLGALYGLLDPAFDTEGAGSNPSAAPEKPASSKKRLMNDDEDDEDEEIDVEESSEEEYEYESPSNNNSNHNHKPPPITNYSSPSRRRTRSCAVPDVLKTKEVVTLDDLMKHGFLRPGDALEFSGLGDRIENGTLVKDGWIEYGTDKYPDMEAWIARVFKDHKRRRKSMDCWETVSARHHSLSYHRDQFLNKMNNRTNYNERKKRLREERKKAGGAKSRHQVPGRSRLVQQESQPIHHTTTTTTTTNNDDEDEEVMIDDDEPTTNNLVLPHKKRKTDYSKHEPANKEEKQPSSSSSVDMLGEVPSALLREDTELLPDAYDNLAKQAKAAKETKSTWLGKRKKDDTDENPSTPPQAQPPKKETEPSPLSRRRTETQAQEFDEDEEDHPLGPRTSSSEKEEKEEQLEEKGGKEEDPDETRDDEDDATRDDEADQTHDSLAPHSDDVMPHPPSGKLHPQQPLQHITSPHSSSSTNASSSSSDLQPWVDKQSNKSNFPQHTMDSSDMGSFAARLDEHEKEADLLETLSSKKLSQTKTKQTSPPAKPTPVPAPTPTPSKPTVPTKSSETPKKTSPPKKSDPPTKSSTKTSDTPKKSSDTPKKSPDPPIKASDPPKKSSTAPSVPPKANSKPTPSIPPSTPAHPPKFTLPPSSESVSPIATPTTPPTPTPTTPATPATPATLPTTSFTTPNTARKPAQSVVFTPAKPASSAQALPVSPSPMCKDGKERTILTTGLRSDMLCTLQALLAQLGGRTVDEFDDTQGVRVTHVVTGLTAGDDTHRAQRTLKYCCGVLCGAWIVSFEWVLESLAAREWVDESDFELRGDTHGAGAPKKARIAMRKGSPRLFNGLRICFAGDFTQPSRKDMQRVARIGGADILATLPSPTTTMPEYLAEVKHTHVVIDPERTDAAAAQEIHLTCGLVPLSYHWLLDSVSHYTVQPFDKYRIAVQEEGRGYETQQSLEF